MTLYLIDTCVWRDFYENRISKSGNPIGKYATEFFMKIVTYRYKILFSEGIFKELNLRYSYEEINNMLNVMILNKILIKIETTKQEIIESKQLSMDRKVPFMDCLNVIQARNNNAILITRDKHYFEKLQDIAKILRPEEII